MFTLRHVVVAAGVAILAQGADAGLVTVSVAGINNAVWQWDVPMLVPGQTWQASFERQDGGSYVDGYMEAGVSANGRGAWFTITDFILGSDHGTVLLFECQADIDFAVGFSGWANPYQEFDADQAINSGNARIDWSKGAFWNQIPLPNLAGHFAPDDLTSSLFASSARFGYFTSPVHLRSATLIVLRTGGLGDAVELPESAHDQIEIPGPATLAALGGLLMLAKRRRA